MPKKYSRVSAHHRIINGKQVWVIAHIRQNPRFKETKMQNEDKGPEREQPRDLSVKEFRPSHVNVNIRETESHYLASFNHGPTRVFHNVRELLVVIEVEVNRLTAKLRDG